MQLAVIGAHFGNVDMEVADGIGFEGLLRFSFRFHVRQSGNAMALVEAMQAGAGQVRDRVLQGV